MSARAKYLYGTVPDGPAKLFYECRRLAARAARAAWLRCGGAFTLDELMSFADEGLWAAACMYDPSRGLFEHLAKVKIRGAIIDGMRSCGAMRRVRLGKPQHPDKPEPMGLLFWITDPGAESATAEAETARLLRSAIADLPDDRSSELIRRHYLGGERFDHVAAELGLSKSWASRLHKAGLSKLRVRLAAKGVTP